MKIYLYSYNKWKVKETNSNSKKTKYSANLKQKRIKFKSKIIFLSKKTSILNNTKILERIITIVKCQKMIKKRKNL